MIYELALVARPEISEGELSNLSKTVHEVVKSNKGEILIEDDWGKLSFAQSMSSGAKRGHYLYFIYSVTSADNNAELSRRFGISEDILKHMIVKLGEEKQRANIVKNYKTPFSKKYHGSAADQPQQNSGDDVGIPEEGMMMEEEGDRKRFARRRGCWFIARNIKADWKDPPTYTWLVNEFGKISPCRVSGISTKHQRFVTTAIKRARQLGIASHLTDRIASSN